MCCNKEFELQLIEGIEGSSIALNNFRIAGPRPWGGGNVKRTWMVKIEDIEKALRAKIELDKLDTQNPGR